MAWKSCQNSALNEDIQTAKLFSKQNLTDSASLSKLNESESTRPNPLSPESIAIEDLVSALSESDLEILNWVSRVPNEQISNTLGTKFQPENSLSKSTTEVKSKIELSSQQKEPTNLNSKRTKKDKDLAKERKERKERKRRGKSEAPGNKRNKKKKHDEVEAKEEEETKEQKIVQSSQNYENVNDFHLNTQNNYQSSLENKLENISKKQKLEKPDKNSKKSLKASKFIVKTSKTSKSKAENGWDSIPVQTKSSPKWNSVLQIFKISRSPANKSNSSP